MAKKLAKSAISQKRVLDAAAKIFRDFGYAGTTMRAIADEADLKAGSIYYHYKSKDELIGAVLDIGVNAVTQRVTEALAALPPEATGRQRVEVAIAAHLSAIIEVGDYTLATRRVAGQVPEAISARNTRLRDSYGAMWQQIMNDAQQRGEFKTTASLTLSRLFILGALNWTVEWYKPGGRSVEQIARDFASFVLDGLSGGAAPLPVELSEAATEPHDNPRPRIRSA
ncbi:MAG: TetR family transcriptional regulator [Rhizobiaceae bacterium]|nr:TetR family transcriptional regulator [Rhizobiaceae bacterium]